MALHTHTHTHIDYHIKSCNGTANVDSAARRGWRPAPQMVFACTLQQNNNNSNNKNSSRRKIAKNSKCSCSYNNNNSVNKGRNIACLHRHHRRFNVLVCKRVTVWAAHTATHKYMQEQATRLRTKMKIRAYKHTFINRWQLHESSAVLNTHTYKCI